LLKLSRFLPKLFPVLLKLVFVSAKIPDVQAFASDLADSFTISLISWSGALMTDLPHRKFTQLLLKAKHD
jgi:hypothetical protein